MCGGVPLPCVSKPTPTRIVNREQSTNEWKGTAPQCDAQLPCSAGNVNRLAVHK